MVEIVPAAELGAGARRAVTEVFVDAFGPDFVFFSKDKARLAAAFAHMPVVELFHIALVDGEPAGIAALTDGTRQSMVPRGSELRRHLGLVRGAIGTVALGREFAGGVPGAGERTGSIEFVGTATRFQGRGIGRALLTHLLALPGYDEFVLEAVSDINVPALRLYERLGFVEYKRVPVWHTRLSGIHAYLSLKLVPDRSPGRGRHDDQDR